MLIVSGTQGAQRLTELGKRGLLDPARLVAVGDVTGAKNADIEDVFTVNDYLTLFNAAMGESSQRPTCRWATGSCPCVVACDHTSPLRRLGLPPQLAAAVGALALSGYLLLARAPLSGDEDKAGRPATGCWTPGRGRRQGPRRNR